MPYETYAKGIATLTYEEQLDLMELLISAIRKSEKEQSVQQAEDNFINSYPNGYFDLFGSNPDFPSEPDDIYNDFDDNMFIAATALANNATLVTNNTNEFARVKGLTLENWQI